MDVLEVVLYANNTLGSSSAQGPLVLLKLCLQVVFNDLINGLNLTVGLRMINQREVFINAKFVVEFSKFLTVKLHSIIKTDLLRYVVLA